MPIMREYRFACICALAVVRPHIDQPVELGSRARNVEWKVREKDDPKLAV